MMSSCPPLNIPPPSLLWEPKLKWPPRVLTRVNTVFFVVLRRKLNFQKDKVNSNKTKLCSLWKVHFVLPNLFVFTLAFDKAILYGSVAFSIIALSGKKQSSSSLKSILVFLKTYFIVKALKIFKISSDCYIRICRSLKRMAILKISGTVFKRNLLYD